MRGLIFTLDMILGIFLVLLTLASSYYLFSSHPFYEESLLDQKKAIAGDFLGALSEIKVREAYESPTLNMLKDTELTEDQKDISVLDMILTYKALSIQEGNATKEEITRNITNEFADYTGVLGGYNFSLMFANDSAIGNYSSTNNSISVSDLIENTYGSESGYGYMARAYLSSILAQRSRYIYFGGFTGEGNISCKLLLPDYTNINGALLNIYSPSNISLYINGNFSGSFIVNSSTPNFSANIVSASINLSSLHKGNNSVEIRFNSTDYLKQYIGGGFLRVDYTTQSFYEERAVGDSVYFFPGVEGIINVYDGAYVSGNLTESYLHYYNEIPNSEVYLNFANFTLYSSNLTGWQNVTLNSSNMSSSISQSGLDFSSLIGTTVPIKIGTRILNYTNGQGYGDAVLITDVSGSMSTCDVITNGTYDCTNSTGHYRGRINVAKTSGGEFISGMLNVSGNRAGLVSFDTNVVQYYNLSDNNQSLQDQISNYAPGASTCICCGINKSSEILSAKFMTISLVGSSSVWRYNLSHPASSPAEISGKNWTDFGYNDSNWTQGSPVFGFSNLNWTYRTPINISNIAGNLSNYPVRISINLSSDYTAGRIRQYCEDVRFTYYNSTSGTEYETLFMTESCNLSGSGNSSFFVKMPFMQNKTNTTFYLYYGNTQSVVMSASNSSVCPAGIIKSKCARFFNGFEDSSGEGTDGFNTSVWLVEYGDDDNEARAEQDSGDYRTGSWAAEMEEGDEGEVAISTQPGIISMPDTKNYRLEFWLKLPTGSWESGHKVYVDLYNGTWKYGAMSVDGPTYDIGSWVNFTLDLSLYNLSNSPRIRFDQEATKDSEESHIDDIMVYYSVSNEPAISSIGSQQSISKSFSGINITTNLTNNGGNYFFRKEFYLESTDKMINSTLYIFSDDMAEVYINGNLTDNDTSEHNASYWNRQINSTSYLKSGWNTVAVKLINNDNDSALFDLLLDGAFTRKRAMLVMSDGEANYECTPHQSSSTQGPIDAIQYACNARDDNITIYSVAFGSSAGSTTLMKIACWNCTANDWLPGENATNCSRFFQSNNAEELSNIYQKIAHDIVNMSVEKQAVYIFGGENYHNVLSNDSYIKMLPPAGSGFSEGEFLMTFEKNCTNGICTVNKSNGTSIIDAKITSYSGDYWSDAVILRNSSSANRTVYNLSHYGDFNLLGDPYSISINPSYISNGQNNISLYMGTQAGSPQNESKADKIIYSIKVPGYVGYGGEGYVFNSSQAAVDNATQRLIQYVESVSGESLSSYGISTSLSLQGIRMISDISRVKFIIW